MNGIPQVFSDEEAILQDLSSTLRGALLRYMHKDVIEQIPIFEVCSDPGFVDILVRAMRPLFCSPQDVIVSEGKAGHEMFFLVRGRVEVLHAGSRPADQPVLKVCELSSGDYFGEVALIDNTLPGLNPNRRVATVRALAWCELQSVGKEHLMQCFEEFPEVQEHIMTLVRERISRLRELNNEDGQSTGGNTSIVAYSLYRPPAGEEMPEHLSAAIATVQKIRQIGGGAKAAHDDAPPMVRADFPVGHRSGSGSEPWAQEESGEASMDLMDVEKIVMEMEALEAQQQAQALSPTAAASTLPGLRLALTTLKSLAEKAHATQQADLHAAAQQAGVHTAAQQAGVHAKPSPPTSPSAHAAFGEERAAQPSAAANAAEAPPARPAAHAGGAPRATLQRASSHGLPRSARGRCPSRGDAIGDAPSPVRRTGSDSRLLYRLRHLTLAQEEGLHPDL